MKSGVLAQIAIATAATVAAGLALDYIRKRQRLSYVSTGAPQPPQNEIPWYMGSFGVGQGW